MDFIFSYLFTSKPCRYRLEMENFWRTLYIAYDIIIKEVRVERIISYY